MEVKNPNEERSGTYETGVTQPWKSYRGVIAVLLMVVIFLSGVVTALGFVNVHLFRQLQTDSDDQVAPVSFEAPTDGELSPYARMDVGTQIPELGIWYVMVSGVCNQYYDIPMGPMVTSATSTAKDAGVRAGDILRTVKGREVNTAQQLHEVLALCENGEEVTVTFYRPSEEKELEVTLPVQK